LKPLCPQCTGECWDNIKEKKSPNGPDLKCKDQKCGWAFWGYDPNRKKGGGSKPAPQDNGPDDDDGAPF
jgi:hypothetical protein